MWWLWVYGEEQLVTRKLYPAAWRYPDGPYTVEHFNPYWQDTFPQYHARLLLWTIFWAAVITVIRSFVVSRIFLPYARKNVIAAGYSQREVVRFTESASRFTFYTISSVAVLYVTLRADYFWYPWQVWWVAEPLDQELFYLYIFEMAWYLHTTFAHLFLDERKKDFEILLFHHFLTLSLLYLSFYMGYTRIALLVLFAHDPCDPFLEAGKMFNYLACKWPAVFSFLGLCITWFVLRILFYPTIIYLALVESFVIFGPKPLGYWVFSFLLWSLQILQWYWFVLIVKVGITVATQPIVPGVDYDDREYTEPEPKTPSKDDNQDKAVSDAKSDRKSVSPNKKPKAD